ncbi:hypothetical protein HY640_02220 [Candidatus Woesearchaeota archaeon]|nr:hypothetical protein [Candidatus Woesearchaeota archaeon]
MEPSGLMLGSRYSRVPNGLGYCGPYDLKDAFLRCIASGDCNEAGKALERFEGLYPYLKLIAAKNERHPFDMEVFEAYWLGNRLLDGFTKEDFTAHLDTLVGCGLPSFIAEKLKPRIPERPIPMHLFHVLFVGVGNVTGSVKPVLDNMDRCKVSLGKVKELGDGKLFVSYSPLTERDGFFLLGKESETEVTYSEQVVPGVAPGEQVSFHWGEACEILDAKRAAGLMGYTEQVIGLVNSCNNKQVSRERLSP